MEANSIIDHAIQAIAPHTPIIAVNVISPSNLPAAIIKREIINARTLAMARIV